jgi:hypothetical protein
MPGQTETVAGSPDDRKWRMIKIVDRRAFAHKLGIDANAEILSLFFTRFLFQQWPRPHCPVSFTGLVWGALS